LPGGFVEYGEDLPTAVRREIAEETGLGDLLFRQFRTYGAPGRDPRGHTVSVVYVARVTGDPPPVQGGDDAAQAAWFPVDDLPELAFDHEQILQDVLS
jgi:8-oxo-dGTP diphosphatase